MGRYLGLQATQGFAVLVAIAISVFVFTRFVGDPMQGLLSENPTPEEVANVTRILGLDQPLHVQFGIWVTNALQGDFGRSYYFGRLPAMDVVLDRLPFSFALAATSSAVSLLLSIPLGVLAALRRNSLVDNFVTGFVLIGQAVPGFALGILLMLVVAVNLGWTPVSGYGTWQHMILPTITLSVLLTPTKMRLVRSRMIEVLESDYVRTARAKGLNESRVIWVHGFRNVGITVVAVLGLEVARLIEGAVVVEAVFAWPGLGSLMISAVGNGDFPVVQAAVTLIAVIAVVVMLAGDLLISLIDPRIRLR